MNSEDGSAPTIFAAVDEVDRDIDTLSAPASEITNFEDDDRPDSLLRVLTLASRQCRFVH